jgi:ribonuclease R
MCPPEEDLVEIGRQAGLREDAAEEAERSLRGFLVLQLLETHLGESYSGVVTNVNPRGIFVQIDKFLADGFVKAEDLPGDVTRENLVPIWRIDAKSGALVDQRSGRSYNFGDTVTVRIVNVDLAKRQMDLAVVNAETRAGGKAKQLFDRRPGVGGGMGSAGGAGFGGFDRGGKMTGSQRRSQKSKSRDKGKKHHRRDS